MAFSQVSKSQLINSTGPSFVGRSKKGLSYGSVDEVVILPLVGPFASSQAVPVNTLSDLSVAADVDFVGSKISAPLKYRDINISSGIKLYASQMYNVIWANKITGSSATSQIGIAADNGVNDGGNGSSGGGCGANNTEGDDGQFGGADGASGGSNVYSGGQGFGDLGWFETTFQWGLAGTGGAGGSSNTSGGAGGDGSSFGTAGGGGGSGAGPTDNGYGGGGGGPLIGIVCNQLLGSGRLWALGGNGGGSEFTDSGSAGGGGGGCIYVATKKYAGGWQTFPYGGAPGDTQSGGAGSAGTDGQARIFEITRANTLVLRTFNQSWDNT